MERNRPFAGLAVSVLHSSAKDGDWRRREDVGFELRARMETDWRPTLCTVREWLTDDDPSVRRAAVVACMVRKRFGTPEIICALLEELERVLDDANPYVRRNLGPFVLGYLGYTYPDVVLPQLRRWVARFCNGPSYPCWNLASAFSQALGRRHPIVALELLPQLANHPSALVRRAVARSLVNVATLAPADVFAWCRKQVGSSASEVASTVSAQLNSVKNGS